MLRAGRIVYRRGVMRANPVPCERCGALMTPQPDGRTYACEYCGAQMLVAVEAHQIAAGLRLDLSNMDAFLTHLAQTLSQGFAERVQVHASGTYVHAIELNLEPDVFLARREAHGVVAQHRKLVRGIALRTETVALDRWVEMLTAAIARHANTNARAAWVLSRLRGGDDR